MSEYRPTEYVVDFGDCRSNRFVGLNMTLIKQNGAKLQERIVRCRDCKFFKEEPPDDAGFCMYWVDRAIYHDADGFCAWGEREDENGR